MSLRQNLTLRVLLTPTRISTTALLFLYWSFLFESKQRIGVKYERRVTFAWKITFERRHFCTGWYLGCTTIQILANQISTIQIRTIQIPTIQTRQFKFGQFKFRQLKFWHFKFRQLNFRQLKFGQFKFRQLKFLNKTIKVYIYFTINNSKRIIILIKCCFLIWDIKVFKEQFLVILIKKYCIEINKYLFWIDQILIVGIWTVRIWVVGIWIVWWYLKNNSKDSWCYKFKITSIDGRNLITT